MVKPALKNAPPILIALSLFWVAGLWGFYIHIHSISVSDDSQKTQAIIVLTGGPNRINTGLDLLENNRAKYLFISGVNTKVSVKQLLSIWREDVTSVPCCIILGHIAKNTYENATEARDWIQINNIKSVRLVTAGYHMPRALLEFQSILPNTIITPHPLQAENKNLLLLINEYNKTIFTLVRLKTDSQKT